MGISLIATGAQIVLLNHIQSHWYADQLCGAHAVVSLIALDVVKVRLMNDKHRHLDGVVHCVKNILLHEGPLAFYKGFGMCWGRVRSFITGFYVFTLTKISTVGYTYGRQLLSVRASQTLTWNRPSMTQ